MRGLHLGVIFCFQNIHLHLPVQFKYSFRMGVFFFSFLVFDTATGAPFLELLKAFDFPMVQTLSIFLSPYLFLLSKFLVFSSLPVRALGMLPLTQVPQFASLPSVRYSDLGCVHILRRQPFCDSPVAP